MRSGRFSHSRETLSAHQETMPIAWEKAKVLSAVASTLAIPVVIAFLANAFSRQDKQDELSVRYVELATNILQSEPRDQTEGIREWAVDVLEYYSKVHLPPAVRQDLQMQRLKILAANQQQAQMQQQYYQQQMAVQQQMYQQQVQKQALKQQEQTERDELEQHVIQSQASSNHAKATGDIPPANKK